MVCPTCWCVLVGGIIGMKNVVMFVPPFLVFSGSLLSMSDNKGYKSAVHSHSCSLLSLTSMLRQRQEYILYTLLSLSLPQRIFFVNRPSESPKGVRILPTLWGLR